jgi:predicted transcriptional regulator
MTPEQIYHELKDLAEKLGVTVSEQSFRSSGIPVKSGFCLIKGKMHCIIDKNISLTKKTGILARTLVGLPHENLFVIPAVRDVIQKYGHTKKSVPGKP